jgi:hypothetical protein
MNMLNVAVFEQDICTSGNILPLSANCFPIKFCKTIQLYVEKPG